MLWTLDTLDTSHRRVHTVSRWITGYWILDTGYWILGICVLAKQEITGAASGACHLYPLASKPRRGNPDDSRGDAALRGNYPGCLVN